MKKRKYQMQNLKIFLKLIQYLVMRRKNLCKFDFNFYILKKINLKGMTRGRKWMAMETQVMTVKWTLAKYFKCL